MLVKVSYGVRNWRGTSGLFKNLVSWRRLTMISTS